MSWKFTDWYDKNKDALSTKRKERYRTDAAYRQAIIDRTAARRGSLKSEPRTGQSVADLCEILEVTPWTISRWKTCGYFPVQTLRGYQFTNHQMELLGLLGKFFANNQKRLTVSKKAELEQLVQVIHHNWAG